MRTGVFGRVREPDLQRNAAFRASSGPDHPEDVVAIIGFVLLIGSIELQVRVVEEPYLLRVHGQSYREYLGAVGRFVPGVGLRR